MVFADSTIYPTSKIDVIRENGQVITIDSSMVNFRVIDLDNPSDTIDYAVIDRTWDYFSQAPGLPDSVAIDSIIDSEFYYDSSQFDYFNIIDTVQGSWTDFGFTGSPFGSDYALKVQFSMP